MQGTENSKVVLVTGASSGFGKKTVQRLLPAGYTVIAGLRGGEARLEQVFKEELAHFRHRLFALDLHLDQPASIDAAQTWIEENFQGKLDILINNAGMGLFGSLEDLTPYQLRYQFDVNFFGPIFLTRIFVPYLRNAKGKIIFVSSIVGRYTFPLYGSYCSSKFALEAMSEALYYELKPFGIQVGVVEPGAFKTDFNQRSKWMAEGSKDPGSLYLSRTRQLRNLLENFTARQGDPERVVDVILRMCTKRKLSFRNLVGKDARILNLIFSLIPDRFRVAAVDFFFRKVVFKE